MKLESLMPLVAAASLGACAVGPNFHEPRPDAPEHWSAQALQETPAPAQSPEQRIERGSRVSEQGQPETQWWSAFHDPGLNALVSRALDSNLDVRLAMLRIEAARAERAVTAAGLWPTLGAEASYTRQRLSLTTPTGRLFNSFGAVHIPGAPNVSVPNPYDQFQLSADAAWELDVFGRVRRSVEAADAGVAIAVEDQHAVRMALLADLATGYIGLRGAQARRSVAEENLRTAEDLLALTRERADAGLTSDIDVSNATAQVSAIRAQIPGIDVQITQNMNLLARLLAREPEALRAELTSPGPMPVVPELVPVGLPADLARRRPDIRQAEAGLHQATAQVGVAVASLFPRLTFSALGGLQSQTAGGLTDWASRFGNMGVGVQLPVFDRGRWKTVTLRNLRVREAALNYQRTVLEALHEVENVLAAYAADQDRRAWLARTVQQNHKVLELARLRYEHGLASFIDVLDAERTLQQNELSLIESGTAVDTDLVRLYRALGGNWDPPA